MVKTPDINKVRVKLLGRLVEREQVWDRRAKKYGITNLVPP
jgi:hypothetical protein